jgi:hypothetical protein
LGFEEMGTYVGQVDAVDQGEGVDYCQRGEESEIDFADDAARFGIIVIGVRCSVCLVDDVLDVKSIGTIRFGGESGLIVISIGGLS